MARPDVKVMAFDVGGSVFDWQTAVRRDVVTLATQHGTEIDDHTFAHAWRRRMFEMVREVRHGDRDWCNADDPVSYTHLTLPTILRV